MHNCTFRDEGYTFVLSQELQYLCFLYKFCNTQIRFHFSRDLFFAFFGIWPSLPFTSCRISELFNHSFLVFSSLVPTS